jgi:hypothetical protein
MPNMKFAAVTRPSNNSVRTVPSRASVRSHQVKPNLPARVSDVRHNVNSKPVVPRHAIATRPHEKPMPFIPLQEPTAKLYPDSDSSYASLFKSLESLPAVPIRRDKDNLFQKLAKEIAEMKTEEQLDLEALQTIIIRPFTTLPSDHDRKLKNLHTHLLKQGVPADSLTEVTVSKGTVFVRAGWNTPELKLRSDGEDMYDVTILNKKSSLQKLINSCPEEGVPDLFTAKMACDTRCLVQKLPDGIKRYYVPGNKYIQLIDKIDEKITMPTPSLCTHPL